SDLEQASTLVPADERCRKGAGKASPWRAFVLTYVLTAVSLMMAATLSGRPGADLLVVALGWPHVILGFLFGFRKVIRSNGRAVYLALIGLSAVIGLVHVLRPMPTVIYLYFVFHAFRDEIAIYRQRSTGHLFRGRVFDGAGLGLLAAVVALSGI